ncbi:MAG: S1C family serine protease, partial [Anaerolineae bacterium]
MSEILQRINADSAQAVARAHQVLVRVSSGRGWRRGAGSGVVWSTDGLIVTNGHVVRGEDYVDVWLPTNARHRARVLGLATNYDLALLKLDAAGLVAIDPGDSANIRTGSVVFGAGHPWGVLGAVTSGVVIGVGADLPERPDNGQEWVAVSLHYRPGHSGGPLVDV